MAERSGRMSDLQPLEEGLSCSELALRRLKALELLGGDRLWELELWGTDGARKHDEGQKSRLENVSFAEPPEYREEGKKNKWIRQAVL